MIVLLVRTRFIVFPLHRSMILQLRGVQPDLLLCASMSIYAVAVFTEAGSMTVSTSTFGIDAPVPARFVVFALGFLV